VIRQDAELPFRTWSRDLVNILIKEKTLWSDNAKSKSFCHNFFSSNAAAYAAKRLAFSIALSIVPTM
jgi:hypothetical protein